MIDDGGKPPSMPLKGSTCQSRYFDLCKNTGLHALTHKHTMRTQGNHEERLLANQPF